MPFKLWILCLNLYLAYQILSFIDCKEMYPSAERPRVTYVNPKYFTYFNLTARRYRRSTVYFMELHTEVLVTVDNKMVLLSNRYKPTFIEAHIKLCDLEKDEFVIGAAMKNALQGMLDALPPEKRFLNSTHCPYPPGVYDLVNITTSRSPLYKTFPFQKGRVFVNITVAKELAAEMYIDLEIKNYY